MNRATIEAAIRMLLEGIGEAAGGKELAGTPARVARMWETELLSGAGQDPRALLSWEPAGEERSVVVIRDIEFTSVCLHHLLPFTGRAGVAYLPHERLCGLSKIVRVVECLSRRLQMQERLTSQILEAVVDALAPRGAACLLVATHQCMSCRGVRQPGARVTTLRLQGVFESSPGREEILRLLGGDELI